MNLADSLHLFLLPEVMHSNPARLMQSRLGRRRRRDYGGGRRASAAGCHPSLRRAGPLDGAGAMTDNFRVVLEQEVDRVWELRTSRRCRNRSTGCASRSKSSARPESGSSWPPTPTVAGSSATSTTGRSSTSSRSRSTCSSRDALADADPAAAKALLDEMGRDVQQAMDETAQLAQRIYPPLLEAGGLAAALRAAAASAGVRPHDRGRGERAATRPRSRERSYFCWLEVLEHAGAGRATRRSRVRDEERRARVRDRRGRRLPTAGSHGCAIASRRSAAG